jgi:hypothetical protein
MLSLDGRALGPLRLSWGVADFGVQRTLDASIEAADAEMYGKRRIARGGLIA